MGQLASMKNIGEELERRLKCAGIDTREDLIALGSREAFRRIKAVDSSACFNMLCALEGAVRGIRWHSLPKAVKDELKAFYYLL